ncbi:MAG: hypothetical protein AAF598_16625 [Bacteroidota bacterium]
MKKSATNFFGILLIACSVSVFMYLNFGPVSNLERYQGDAMEQVESDTTHQTILLPDLDIIEKALQLTKQGRLPFISRF